MSMEAFINGRSVISSSGGFAVPTPAEQRNHEMKLARIKLSSSSFSSSMSYDNTGYASHANITINSNANNATNDGSLTNNKNNNNNEGDDCDTNNIVLAERTSQLMSSYRNYISKQDDEEALMSRIYSEEGSGGNTSHFKKGIRERSSTTNTSSNNSNSNQNQLYSDAPLLREWNSDGTTSRCELEMEDMMNDGDVDSYDKKYRYSHPVFHSKKFKKTMLAIVVVGAVLLAVLIVVRNDRKSALSDWEEELQDVLLLHEEEEEEGDNVVGSESESSVLLHNNVGIGVDLVPVNNGGTQESVSEAATRLPEDDGEEYEDGGARTNTNKAEQDDNNENSHLSMASFDVKEADNSESQNSQPMEMIQEVLNKEKEDQDKPSEDATTESKEEGADDEETASVGGVALPEIVVNPKAAEGNDDVDMDVDEEENASDEGSPEEGEQTTEDNAESSTSEPVNNSNNIEAITRHIMCCSSIAPNTANNNNDNPPPTTSAATNSEEKPDRAKRSAAEEYARAESHRPIWYNRSSGWYGTSYQEGIDFCASQKQLGDDNANNNANNNAKRMMQLCPYEAYCPMGANHIPLGGFRVDTAENGYGGSGLGSGSSAAVSVSGSSSSSRSPIADYQDGWVQVGSDNACLQYTILDGKDGGGDDDNLDDEMQLDANVVGTTDNVEEQGVIGSMVGHQSMTVEPGPSSVTEGLVVKSKEDQEQQQDVAAILVTLHQPEEPATALQTSTINNNSPTTNIANANTVTTAFQQQQQHVDMTNILHQKFKPLWISTHEGWNGGSHDDAVRLCASIRGKKLCPYSAMCPHGPGSAVMGGQKHLEFEVEGEQYAPALGGENHWVMIGSGGEGEEENALSSSSRKCMTHRQLEGRAPEW
eukprot:CAMPEP_0196130710 /NCGR_PEP_ID=MMETSP0910-20130528/989_1 /TAXON_ID=49265 /ORGANISM="Thalassiosira rotula, Strain GSO102" /LENGTH=875 /DNA_ID=CAMNT_0041390065 /DNA_START=113 /DNA_END=2737 /DNA_ORIENTATION=-